MNRIPVSAVVLTFNEEKKIEACLSSISWADEICVIDAESADQTQKICLDSQKPWSSKMVLKTRPWTGFRDQRNFALTQTKNEWVLVVDADEICTPELRHEIERLLSIPSGPPHNAYKIHRQEYFHHKPIFYGMWNPSYQDRFFKKTGVSYINEIHEYPVFKEPPGMIDFSLLHKSDLTIEKFLEKVNRYTSIEAKDRYNQGQRASVFKLIGAFPAHFLKTLFYYKAYRDGMHGLVIALLEGVSRVIRQLKIWQIEIQNKR